MPIIITQAQAGGEKNQAGWGSLFQGMKERRG